MDLPIRYLRREDPNSRAASFAPCRAALSFIKIIGVPYWIRTGVAAVGAGLSEQFEDGTERG
jgi:hypothetical protein